MTSSHRKHVPDVPDAASDSLNATPVLKLSSYLSPQRKQLQGCHGELLSPATDDLASIDRQVAMYHSPHRTVQCPFSRSWRYPASKSGHREVHGWCTSATFAFADDAGVRDPTLRQMAMMNVGVIGWRPILQNKERKLP